MSVRVWKSGLMIIYFDVRILAPISYLNIGNIWKKKIYIYIARPSVLACPSRRRRRRLSVRPSRRPSYINKKWSK